MNGPLTKAQTIGAVITLLCGVVAAAAGTIASVAWIGSTIDGRLDGIDVRLTNLERDVGEIKVELARVDERLEQVVAYLSGRGPRPMPAHVGAMSLARVSLADCWWVMALLSPFYADDDRWWRRVGINEERQRFELAGFRGYSPISMVSRDNAQDAAWLAGVEGVFGMPHGRQRRFRTVRGECDGVDPVQRAKDGEV